MILVDYSAISIAAIAVAHAIHGEKITPEFCKHMILNSIRGYNKKWKHKYGPIYICCDARRNWRKRDWKYYKASRKKNREDSDIDWDLVFEILNGMKEVLHKTFGYHYVEVDYAEADDVIAILAMMATENKMPTVIVSNDKDFFQLHSDYVTQYRPADAKFHNKDAELCLQEHIIRGDADDGVPNIFSDDDTFVIDGKRQSQVTQKRLEQYMKVTDPRTIADNKIRRNFKRNINMIDLKRIPDDIVGNIKQAIEDSSPEGNQRTIMKWLGENRMRVLLSKVNEFC